MDPTPPTDFSSFVLDVYRTIKQTTNAKSLEVTSNSNAKTTSLINQEILRQCLGLASSFLVTDITINPEKGFSTWLNGFNSLVDIVVALHGRGTLELETLSAASKACSECWTAAGTWRGMEECREGVRTIAGRLKKLLDEGGRTYRGEPVYAP